MLKVYNFIVFQQNHIFSWQFHVELFRKNKTVKFQNEIPNGCWETVMLNEAKNSRPRPKLRGRGRGQDYEVEAEAEVKNIYEKVPNND